MKADIHKVIYQKTAFFEESCRRSNSSQKCWNSKTVTQKSLSILNEDLLVRWICQLHRGKILKLLLSIMFGAKGSKTKSAFTTCAHANQSKTCISRPVWSWKWRFARRTIVSWRSTSTTPRHRFRPDAMWSTKRCSETAESTSQTSSKSRRSSDRRRPTASTTKSTNS